MSNPTTQNRVTLKKVSYSASLSEETSAFTADVYFDGKRIAYASNRGHGGPTDINAYEGQGPKVAEAEAYAKTFPHTGVIGGQAYDFGMHSLESIVDDLLASYLTERDLKRLLKKTVGIVGTEVRVIKAPYSPETAAAFRKQHPDVVLLNELPFEEALKRYLATPGG